MATVPPAVAQAAQLGRTCTRCEVGQVIDEENPTKLSAAYERAFK